MLSVPSAYAVALEGGEGERLRGLRVVIVAGEACPAAAARRGPGRGRGGGGVNEGAGPAGAGRARRRGERAGGARLYNESGPTEATVWSSVYECEGAEEVVPIGRAAGHS